MHSSRALCAAAGFALAVSQLSAQIPRPNPMGGPTGSGSTMPGAAGNSPTLGGDTPGSIGSARTGPMMLTGKVVLNDGSAPPEPVRIERVCNSRGGGLPHPEGFTDSKGRFSITLGQENDIMPDASETESRNVALGSNSTSGLRESDLMNCDLRAVLPGFTSDTISLATRRYLDNPDVGTIVLHRMNNVEGLTISATSGLAPKDARKAYEKAMDDLRKKKPDEAQKSLEKAVGIYPKYAIAWYQLGRLYEDRHQAEQARNAYHQAIAADSKYINPYERLYLIGADEKKWQEVAENSDRVMHLNPFDFPEAYYFNAIANLELGKLDDAEKSGREAVKQDAAHKNPRTEYVLGIILARKGQYAPAAELLRAYLQADPNTRDADTVRQQLAQMEKLSAHPQ